MPAPAPLETLSPTWKKPVDVSVVICAYTENRWNELCAAIDSARHQTTPPGEIIIVIDHNPKLLARIRTAMPDICVIENSDVHGASASRNLGVAAARGEVIAFLDDDAVADPEWLSQLLAHYTPNVLGIGGLLIPDWSGGRPGWFPAEFNWVIGCSYTGLPNELSPVRNLIAANMSVRRDIFALVGGFRNGYGCVKSTASSRPILFQSNAGDEETEFCIQALQRFPQGTWLHNPAAKVSHKVPPFRKTFKYFLRRCYDEGFGKALLSQLVGAKDGLASERTYTRKVLPRGILRGMGDTLLRRDFSGLGRAMAILAGLSTTAAGYIIGMLVSSWEKRTQPFKKKEPAC